MIQPMDKEKFLKTELGRSLVDCIRLWDKALTGRGKTMRDTSSREYERWDGICRECGAKWEVFQMMIKQFYGIAYYFTRTEEYFGLTDIEETDWLFKMVREDPIET